MSYWKHSLVVGLALLMATPSVFAQGKSGISVKATGLVKLRADVLEIDANVSGSSELAGDAITKYRNNRQRAVEAIEALPKGTPLAFLCHHGSRSGEAAEHFRTLGFSEVHNIIGGIDAWAALDPAVPRY